MSLICEKCNKTCEELSYRGDNLTELVLYLLGIVTFIAIPIALVYTTWRRAIDPNACPNCKAENSTRIQD